jgi:FkbM family methyltransferase
MLTKDSIVLDIGANMGQYACRINNILKNGDGEVYSFEPVNTNFMALRSMKRKLKLTKVTINHFGISNINGEATINIPIFKGDLVVGTQATLLDLDARYKMSSGIKFKTEVIKLTTIDDFVSENQLNRVDFIKSDTEGNECKVLEGGKATITKHLPILVLELSHNDKCLNWIYNLGYSPFYYDSKQNKLRLIKTKQISDLILFPEKIVNNLNNIIE